MTASNGVLKPHPTDWLTPDISLSVMPPVINTASQRSTEALEAVLDQFDVEHAARYRPRTLAEVEIEMKHLPPAEEAAAKAAADKRGKKLTFCNKAVSDFSAALCAPVPARLGGEWQDVRAQVVWLRAGYNGWKPCTSAEAQAAANEGRPAVVAFDVGERAHGHIAMLTPSKGKPGVWLCQAGARCYRRAPLVVGFGALGPLQFFHHD